MQIKNESKTQKNKIVVIAINLDLTKINKIKLIDDHQLFISVTTS